MHNNIRLVYLIIGLLLSTKGFADDAHATSAAANSLSITSGTIRSLLEESPFEPRWQLYHPVAVTSYPDRWIRPINDFEFRDNSALGRISKLRNLSLLTLAESGRTRLFLGVNDDGLVGLHFVALKGYGDERHLSLARMPYLKKRR